MSGGVTSVTSRNNIFAAASGPAFLVALDSEYQLASDDNLFDLSGTGAIATWEGVSYTGLTAWYYATGLDRDSIVGDPKFAGGTGAAGYALLAGSPAIDAGDPSDVSLVEGVASGGRINIGAAGDTVAANPTPAPTVQILTSTLGAKYEVGQQVAIDFRASGLAHDDPVLLMNAGGPAVRTGDQQLVGRRVHDRRLHEPD